MSTPLSFTTRTSMDFPHRVITGNEESAVIANVMAAIPLLNRAGTKDRWDVGWGEILERYKASGDTKDLRPQYIRPNQPVRLNGRFVMPEDPDVEMKWYEDFFDSIASRWMFDCAGIHEFGCGSGHNIATLAAKFPKAYVCGWDWSEASVEILREMNRRGMHRVLGNRFDLFQPLDPAAMNESCVFTVGCMEQTGTRWRPFLEYLLACRPRRVVHIEPILSLYDPYNPVDATAIAAHKARGFWEGYEAELRRRVGTGEVEILHIERTGFGSLFCEGYSVLAWRPT
jgi:hypothetical protein